jgi:membrane protease YdiL (CAAX protease family)
MSEDASRLADSAFIADLSPKERSLWRFLATLAVGAAAFFVAALIGVVISLAILVAFAGWPIPTDLQRLQDLLARFVALARSDGRSLGDELQLLAIAIPDNVLPIFSVIGVAALINDRPLRAYLSAAPKWRWTMLLSGVALSMLIIGPFVAVNQLMDPKAGPAPVLTVSRDPALCVTFALISVAAFLPAALGEEMLFRGWLLRELSGLTRNPWALIVINGIVFAAAHLQFGADTFLERAILGGALTYMTLRVGGVELSTGAHLANNLMIVLFVEPLTLKPPPSEAVNVNSLTQYAFLIASYVLIAELVVRWAPLRRWTGADASLRPPATAAQFS